MTLGGVGEGNRKYWKTIRVERSGSNLVGRIRKCHRYVIDVAGLVPLSLGELGGPVLWRVWCVGVSGTFTN